MASPNVKEGYEPGEIHERPVPKFHMAVDSEYKVCACMWIDLPVLCIAPKLRHTKRRVQASHRPILASASRSARSVVYDDAAQTVSALRSVNTAQLDP